MIFKQFLSRLKRLLRKPFRSTDPSVDALYQILYNQVHDLEQTQEITPKSTKEAFSKQWAELPTGEFLLSDPWFKRHVADILSVQELLLKKEWFSGKRILDAGCGNGRWAYGFCELEAEITCVDANESALKATQNVLQPFTNPRCFIHSSLEKLDQHVQPESFDLAFSWGVIHHCESFNRSLCNVANTVKPGGFLYLYLYGRESVSMKEDLNLFRERVAYNVLLNEDQRHQFLLKKAKGDHNKVHNVHDIYAPLINRRLEFEEVKTQLEKMGFVDIVRTIDHTELFIRASKGQSEYQEFLLPPKQSPYWFESKVL